MTPPKDVMTEETLRCYEVNYDKVGWEKIAKERADLFCLPVGAASAIECLIAEVRRLRSQLERQNIVIDVADEEWCLGEYDIARRIMAVNVLKVLAVEDKS